MLVFICFFWIFLRKDLNFINNQSLNLILAVCNIFLLYCLALGARKPNIDEMSIFYFSVSVKYDVGSGFEDWSFWFCFCRLDVLRTEKLWKLFSIILFSIFWCRMFPRVMFVRARPPSWIAPSIFNRCSPYNLTWDYRIIVFFCCFVSKLGDLFHTIASRSI